MQLHSSVKMQSSINVKAGCINSYKFKNYCVSGLCPSFGILNTEKKKTLPKPDLFSSSIEGKETGTILDLFGSRHVGKEADHLPKFCVPDFRKIKDVKNPETNRFWDKIFPKTYFMSYIATYVGRVRSRTKATELVSVHARIYRYNVLLLTSFFKIRKLSSLEPLAMDGRGKSAACSGHLTLVKEAFVLSRAGTQNWEG
jgi:hypothetical protein